MNIAIKNAYDDTILTSPKPKDLEIKAGDLIVFSHGESKESIGEIISIGHKKGKDETKITGEILRKVDEKDLAKIEKQKALTTEALEKCRDKVEEIEIPMQITEARLTFDESEVNLFFTAADRIDFKEIVPKLAGLLKKRIHLTQLGMRDRAQTVGGYGICGRKQCCTAGVFKKFRSVTMDAVKKQELAVKGSDKLSGPCGKLLCCLNYEVEEYEQLRKNMPAWGSQVETAKGPGKVIALDILNQRVKVRLDGGRSQLFETKEVKVRK